TGWSSGAPRSGWSTCGARGRTWCCACPRTAARPWARTRSSRSRRSAACRRCWTGATSAAGTSWSWCWTSRSAGTLTALLVSLNVDRRSRGVTRAEEEDVTC
ncbi:unnamed protein product, partial [Heterosigma akashiwo]